MKSAVLKEPKWTCPVGDGANRVLAGPAARSLSGVCLLGSVVRIGSCMHLTDCIFLMAYIVFLDREDNSIVYVDSKMKLDVLANMLC